MSEAGVIGSWTPEGEPVTVPTFLARLHPDDRDCIGAAIRRARTRLPGGGENPVAIVRVPRERMVGTGIASSLVHEVGHQAAALLDLVNSLRPILKGLQRGTAASRMPCVPAAGRGTERSNPRV